MRQRQQYAKDLEKERRNASAANRRASNLEQQAAQLAAQNAELLLSNLQLGESAERLQGEVSALAVANTRLTDQVQELAAARGEEAERFAAEVAALRDRVAGVLQRLFSNEIDEPAAVEALRELGCEVHFVPGSARRAGGGGAAAGAAAEFTIEPRLLLDDPARMARLMQAARAQSGGGSPRLLESNGSGGGSGAGSSSSGLTPRLMHGSIGGGATPPLMLTVGSGNGAPAAPGAPRLVLSWLSGSGGSGEGAASASADGVQDAVPAQPKDASPPKRKAIAAPGAASAAAAAAPAARSKPAAAASSPSKAKAPVQIEQHGDNLVISKQAKVCCARGGEMGRMCCVGRGREPCALADASTHTHTQARCATPLSHSAPHSHPGATTVQAKGPKSRLGLSLTDAPGSLFKRGGGAAAGEDAFDELPGAGGGDVGGSRDLALRR